jgi:hypothetical protein
MIDTRLSADTGVHLSQQRRRRLDDRDAAHVDRGRKPSDVAHHSAAQRDDRRLARHVHGRHPVQQPARRREVFRPLAIGHQFQGKSFFEILTDSFEDSGLGDNKKRAAKTGPFKMLFEILKEPRPHDNVIRRVGQVYRDCLQVVSPRPLCPYC